jgi:hypothetical protein
MSSIRASLGSGVRAGLAVTAICCAGLSACRETVPPSAPAHAPGTAGTPPGTTPTQPTIVVDTGPIPAGRLAFEVESFGRPRIYSMRTDGSGLIALSEEDEIGRAPAWSRDGSKLVYESYHRDAPEIWTVRPDGTGRTLVARNATEPFWLDDARLAYQCGTNICIVRDDGSQQRMVLARDALPNAADFAYRLSSDSRTIAFTRITYLGPGAPSSYV